MFQIRTWKQEIKSLVWDLSAGSSQNVQAKIRLIIISNYRTSNTMNKTMPNTREKFLRLKVVQWDFQQKSFSNKSEQWNVRTIENLNQRSRQMIVQPNLQLQV